MIKITLKAARINKGYNQKAAAEKLKISNKTLCSWENGSSFPTAEKIKEMCELYEIPFDNLNFLPTNPL